MNNLTDRENRMLAVMADLDRAASRANTAYFLSPYSSAAASLHEQDMMKALCRVVDALGYRLSRLDAEREGGGA